MMNKEMDQKGDGTQVCGPQRYTRGADARGAKIYSGCDQGSILGFCKGREPRQYARPASV